MCYRVILEQELLFICARACDISLDKVYTYLPTNSLVTEAEVSVPPVPDVAVVHDRELVLSISHPHTLFSEDPS
jgi:hypothetical protein